MKRCSPFGKSKDSLKFKNLFKTNLIPVTNTLTPGFLKCHLEKFNGVPVAFVVGQLVLHWGNTHAIMCKCSDVSQQMQGQWSLQIICTYAAVSWKFSHCYFLRDLFDALCDNYYFGKKCLSNEEKTGGRELS